MVSLLLLLLFIHSYNHYYYCYLLSYFPIDICSPVQNVNELYLQYHYIFMTDKARMLTGAPGIAQAYPPSDYV